VIFFFSLPVSPSVLRSFPLFPILLRSAASMPHDSFFFPFFYVLGPVPLIPFSHWFVSPFFGSFLAPDHAVPPHLNPRNRSCLHPLPVVVCALVAPFGLRFTISFAILSSRDYEMSTFEGPLFSYICQAPFATTFTFFPLSPARSHIPTSPFPLDAPLR